MRLYQIYYDDATRRSLDPGFLPLDNTRPERPDLYEYWPIRNLLLSESFADDEYIGVFSPRLHEKTSLTAADIQTIVGQSSAEVISFSPCFEEIACYPNSFVQGDIVHPGLFKLSQAVLDKLDLHIDLHTLVQDQTRTIYSNYFVARYRFWKDWLALSERVLELARHRRSKLGKALNAKARHRTDARYSMKVFILERLVSVLLESKHLNAEVGMNLPSIPITWPDGDRVFAALMGLDALKGQLLKTGLPSYRKFYEEQRWQVLRLLALDMRG
jgi:hypothetical protein